MREAGIAFEEVRLRLDFAGDSPFKRALAGVAPGSKVPVLVDVEVCDAGGRPLAVWDTFAIAEYLAEEDRWFDRPLPGPWGGHRPLHSTL